MFLYTLVIPIILCVLTAGGLYLIAGKDRTLDYWEYSILFVPIIIWNILVLLRFGPQSLSNIIEVYLLALIIIGYLVLRVLKPNLSRNLEVVIIVAITVLPILLRTLFPLLKE